MIGDVGLRGTWDDALIAAAIIITSCGVIWRGLLRPLLQALRNAATINDTLLEIAKEFQPNHGTSLKDVMQEISGAVNRTGNELNAFVIEHRVVHDKLEAELSSLDAKIASVHDEVTTSSGMTLAALADVTEGRRITANIPEDRRTKMEQEYVDTLDNLDDAG